MKIKIAPSILSADFSRLGEQVKAALDAGAEYIHVDVMDGHFVPNLTIGSLIVEAIKPLTHAAGAILDVHLMIENPEALIPDFIRAGADSITVHVETCPHLHRTIHMIKHAGVKVGVTMNPSTPLVCLDQVLEYVDMVLILSVNPGFGGQDYIPSSTAKIKHLRELLDQKGLSHIEIEVDGGIKANIIAEVVSAGATIVVAGSAVFNSDASIAENITALRSALK